MIAALENGDEKILANCIQITSEFYDRMNASHRIELIHLIEFHALVSVGVMASGTIVSPCNSARARFVAALGSFTG